MKRVLFIATTDINGKDGGGLGQKAYHASFAKLFPNQVDIIMPAEYVDSRYPNAMGAPKRGIMSCFLSGSIHRYKDYVDQYLREHVNVYSLCVISGGLYAGDMMDMIHSYGLKILVIHLNFEREYQMDNKSLWTFYGRTPFFVVRNERKAYKKADCNCFMSKADVELFEASYGHLEKPSVIVGAYEYEDLPNETPLVTKKEYKRCIAITGSLNTEQTIAGIRDFRNNYYKIVKETYPDWNIVMAGRNPSDEIMKFQKDNAGKIEVIPNPEDMKEIILNSDIFLCPTNVGGGIKLRVMDGLKYGRPILVHKVSARGYDSMFDCPFFKVYDDPTSFRKGLMELVEYIESNNDHNYIRTKYLEYFSLSGGTSRFKSAINMI